MVEIRYGELHEVADLAGQSLAEARESFKGEFGISAKAKAKLNGKKVKAQMESEICICDDDKITFAEEKSHRAPFLVGAMLLALVVTGGVFAYGYTTASTDLTTVTSAGADFASVTSNTSDRPTWNAFGKYKGTIAGPKPIFDVSTMAGPFTGDWMATVSIANADELVGVYRGLALFIEVYGSHGNPVDVDGSGAYSATQDYALLTLGNGSVDLYISANATGDYYTIKVKNGFYNSHITGQGWSAGYEQPLLYCEVAQR
ncbi:hypothetical protein ACFLWG_04120 [Chloroflexota bacterium]